jgi:hypothetical protein
LNRGEKWGKQGKSGNVENGEIERRRKEKT